MLYKYIDKTYPEWCGVILKLIYNDKVTSSFEIVSIPKESTIYKNYKQGDKVNFFNYKVVKLNGKSHLPTWW